MSMAGVSVVIPTKNAGSGFRQSLERIRSQEVSDVEIIVVDSGSTDGTISTAEELADTTIEISPDAFHHGRTRNQGAELAEGDIIVFTVQDAIPVNDTWLAELIAPIEAETADITYGNQIAYPDAKPPNKYFYEYFYPEESIILSEEDTDDDGAFYIDNIFLSDVNSAISHRVWKEFQFRDSIAMSEDKDFAFRAASAGYTIQYCPEAKMYHSHDYTLQSMFTRRYRDGKAFADIADTESDDFITDGIRYVGNKYLWLLRRGEIRWIPYSMVYDLLFFISFKLGQHHEGLPEEVNQLIES